MREYALIAERALNDALPLHRRLNFSWQCVVGLRRRVRRQPRLPDRIAIQQCGARIRFVNDTLPRLCDVVPEDSTGIELRGNVERSVNSVSVRLCWA